MAINLNEYTYIKDSQEAIVAARELLKEAEIGFDTETNSLNPLSEGAMLRLVQFSTLTRNYIFDIPTLDGWAHNAIRRVLESESVIKVGHNLKFDMKFAAKFLGVKWFGKCFDTMLAAQILAHGNANEGFSLEAVVERYLNENLVKDEQVSDWTRPELRESQLQYAALDAQVVLDVRRTMIPQLIEEEQVGVASIEFGCIWAVAQMELNGFYLDGAEWRIVTDKVVEDRGRIRAELSEMLCDTVLQQALFEGAPLIDVDSSVELNGALLAKGIKLPTTKKGNISTQNYKIKPLETVHREIAKLLEYRGVKKTVESYGYNFTNNINPITGRIHASYRQIGALTGRFACDKPNLQQIPHDPLHRGCFKAQSGKTLVIADYSQIELRILAEFSSDKAFIEAFLSGVDLHLKTAADVFGLSLEDAKAKRPLAKNLNFGVVYGIGYKRFAMQTGLSDDEAKEILRSYNARYPQMSRWLAEQAEQALAEKWSRTGSGRLITFEFDADDDDAASKVERNGKNTPIQGTSADMLKRALRLISEELFYNANRDVKLVHIVHDEVILECSDSDSDWAAAMLERCMVQAGEEFLKVVPVKVETQKSPIWIKD